MGLDINVAALGDWVPHFVRVNNRLAGITRAPTAAEISAHRGLLAVNTLCVENLELFVHHIAPGTALREARQDDCRPEDETAVDVRSDLSTIVAAARARSATPDRLHRVYRMLRPFTDANGRCGRALWMWQVMRSSQRYLAVLARLDLLDAKHPLNSDAVRRSKMI